ncbi:MAG: hypothetical protein IPO67_16600 [Deltaproteobacteria bacterium]|nr:hypothetical protein [Deltaproteobacteria bacterium]
MALLDESVDGAHYSTFDQEGEVCPEGWEYVGGGYDSVACHKAGNEGAPVTSTKTRTASTTRICPTRARSAPRVNHLGGGNYTRPARPRALGRGVPQQRPRRRPHEEPGAGPGEVCPEGWQHVGGGYYTQVCAKDGGGAIGTLNKNKDLVHMDELDNEGDVCPEGWNYLGGGYQNVACEGAKPGNVLLLNDDVNGVHIDDMDNPGDAAPTASASSAAGTTIACADI